MAIPSWALEILRDPGTGAPLRLEDDRLVAPGGGGRAVVADGVVRFRLPDEDPSIRFYRDVGGPRFHERARVGYAMTTLDTSVYHGYLAELRPEDDECVIVDVGGGDGRNTLPWLEWGSRRIVLADAAGDALARFRARVAARAPEWLDRILLVEADARALPLAGACAKRVVAIEALEYLNDDYRGGLAECARVMADDGRLMVADRDYEGALIARLFYAGGVAGLVEQAGGRDVLDGNVGRTLRSRSFTAAELAAEVEAVGLGIVRHDGISVFSLLLGYLRNTGRIGAEDEERLPEVQRLLARLGREGVMRRSHVVVAERRRS